MERLNSLSGLKKRKRNKMFALPDLELILTDEELKDLMEEKVVELDLTDEVNDMVQNWIDEAKLMGDKKRIKNLIALKNFDYEKEMKNLEEKREKVKELEKKLGKK